MSAANAATVRSWNPSALCRRHRYRSCRRCALRRLDDFRGASRFTTWAYKFALLEAAVKPRKRAWQGREVPLEPEGWGLLASAGLEPDAEAVVLAERLNTSRGALYKTLHDARRKLRPHLQGRGLALDNEEKR
jgi:RNA polymerase sigma-70 factor (ECF subfamily)